MTLQPKTSLEPARTQIREDFKSICEQEHIVPELERLQKIDLNGIKTIWIKGTQRRFLNKREVLIKMRPTISQETNPDFIDIQRRLAVIHQRLTDAGIRCQKIFKLQSTKAPEWTLLEFIAGEPIGRVVYKEAHLTNHLIEYLAKLEQDLLDLPANGLDLPSVNNSRNWLNEYAVRRRFVEEHLGHSIAEQIANILSNTITFTKLAPIHSDLAPDNILVSEGTFVAIDWGGLKLGPPALDWGSAWAFGVLNRDWQDQLLERYLDTFALHQKEEAIISFQQVAARLLATIAEGYNYYSQDPSRHPEFLAQAKASLDAYPHALARVLNVKP
jgi:aminoglycoside phosphotransferase (APT) family kinase protein